MKTSHTALLLIAIFADGPQLWADDARLAGDAYVSATATASNFGALPTLNVGNGSTAFLLFDTPSLPAGASIASAQLIFFVDRVNVAGHLDIHTAASPWTEASITSSSSSFTPVALATAAIPAGGFATADVTSLVQSWVAGTAPNYGIAITSAATDPFTQVSLDSKENTSGSHPARLQMTFTGPAGSAGPVGSQGPAGSAGPKGLKGVFGPDGPIPFEFFTLTSERVILCDTKFGCSLNDPELVTVSCPLNSIRVSPVYCGMPGGGLVNADSLFLPAYNNTDVSCSYSGSLGFGERITLGVTALCVRGVAVN
jgi:hypothetical protein